MMVIKKKKKEREYIQPPVPFMTPQSQDAALRFQLIRFALSTV